MVLYADLQKPSMDGKVVVITGASAGIGLEAARILVRETGAHVVLACRNLQKAKPFEDELNTAGPGKATLLRIDTSDLASVREFAAAFLALGLARLDVLLLNAGIMMGDWRTARAASEDTPEVELQFATNHLGHFLLTQLLLPTVVATPGSRIVSVSSVAAGLSSAMNYDVICARKAGDYRPGPAYANTKLANLLFTRELMRRLNAAGAGTVAVACHPGYSRTSLQVTFDKSLLASVERVLFRPFVSQPAVDGAHPLVLAALDPSPDVKSGVYYAPSGFLQLKGPASSTAGRRPSLVTDEAAAELWTVSEELCGESSPLTR
jgi:NAD(P)-dependent dehydrogenase (short-subunit alcohol dehydrogenase family)